MDAVLPWRFEEEPLPPPVPPKNELRARQAVATIPERVTPWLLRRVKTPVTRAGQTAPVPAPQKASADIRGFPKPEPPTYHAVPQQQIHPSEERLAIMTSRPVVVQSRSTVQVHPRTPPKPAVADRSARKETQRGPTLHSGSPQLRSVRSAHEERSRPEARAPLRHAPQPERVHLPSYHSAETFQTPPPPPPPYRASAEDSHRTSGRSRSLPRSSHKHGPAFDKEATPPLPQLPSHPPLSSSAKSRILAGYKVSNEFGNELLRQEQRLATRMSDDSGLDPVPNPRLGRRFLSASEMQSHRKAKLCTDKTSLEHEARQRTSKKSSPNVGRCSGDSRLRTASAHSGRGQDTKGRSVARDKR